MRRMRFRFYRQIDTRQRAANHFKKGMKLYREGTLKPAFTAFDDAAKVHSDTADAYFWMGRIYLDWDKKKKARKAFHRYLRYFKRSAAPSSSLDFIFENGFIDKKVLQEYRAELNTMRADPAYWLLRGRTEVRIGAPAKGIASYKKGLAIDSLHFKLLQQIGRTLSDIAEYSEAVSYLNRLMTHYFDRAEGADFSALGDSLRGLKKYAEAYDAYENGLKRDPKSGYYRVVMALCCLNQGKRMQANSLLNENSKKAPDFPFTYYFRGLLLEQDFQNYPEAIENYERFLELLRGREIPLANQAKKRIIELEKKLDESSE